MVANPIVLSIPAGAKAVIQAVSNAAWYQQLTLDWGDGAVVLSGSGERVPMATADGRTMLAIAPSAQGYQVSVTFRFSQTPSGPFLLGTVQEPIITKNDLFSVVEVMSEDSSDNDNNDTYLTLIAVDPGQDSIVDPSVTDGEAVVGHSAAAFDASLELHAKTYYNNPSITGGDEHHFTVPARQGSGAMGYRGTSWSLRKARFMDVPTRVGGYLNVLVQLYNCQVPGMRDLVLTLEGWIGYWGARPVGRRSANWTWHVTGTGRYTVTRVTD